MLTQENHAGNPVSGGQSGILAQMLAALLEGLGTSGRVGWGLG
jgi:hypothetical protein